MLKIYKEFRKGILFIRLKGSLNKDTLDVFNTEVTKIIKNVGIYNVVFNISLIDSVDLEGVKALLYLYNLCRRRHGVSMLCGVKSSFNKVLNNNKLSCMFQIKNEMEALDLIRI